LPLKNRLLQATGKKRKPVRQAKAGVIMARKLSRNKRKSLGIRIKPKEGLWVKYQFGLRGITLTAFAQRHGVKEPTVTNVLKGLRKSARLEEAVVQTLGYPSFEAMIAAARGKGKAI
jgi:hypothetical protein